MSDRKIRVLVVDDSLLMRELLHAALIEAALDLKVDQVQMNLSAATPEAIVAEVRYTMRTTGPANLDSLEPQYLRPSDAKLPDRPLRAEPSS